MMNIEQYRQHPVARFLVVGFVNFVLIYAVYLIAIQFIGYRPAYWISVGVGLLFMSVLNIRHTFSRRLSLTSIVIYGLYYYGYSLLHVTLISVLIEQYGVLIEIAPLITLMVLTPPHYLVSKILIHKIAHTQFKKQTD